MSASGNKRTPQADIELINACVSTPSAQKTVIDNLEEPTLTYLLSSTDKLQISDTLHATLIQKMLALSPTPLQLVMFMLTSGVIDKDTLRTYIRSNPKLFIEPINDKSSEEASAPIYYMMNHPGCSDLLDELFNQLALLQKPEAESKAAAGAAAAAASPTCLLDEIISKNPLKAAQLTVKMANRGKEAYDKFLALINDAVIDRSLMRSGADMIGFRAQCLFSLGNLALLERMVQSHRLTLNQELFTEMMRLADENELKCHTEERPGEWPGEGNTAKLIDILSDHTHSLLTLNAWFQAYATVAKKLSYVRHPTDQSKAFDKLHALVGNPKKAIKEQPGKLIDFLKIAIKKTNVDLDKWFDFLEEAISACEKPKHKADLIMLLANALLERKDEYRDDYVRAHRAMQQLPGTEYLDGKDNLTAGTEFVDMARVEDPGWNRYRKAVCVLALTSNRHTVARVGLLHLAAAKDLESEGDAKNILRRSILDKLDDELQKKLHGELITLRVNEMAEDDGERESWAADRRREINQGRSDVAGRALDLQDNQFSSETQAKIHDAEINLSITYSKKQLSAWSQALEKMGWSALGKIIRKFYEKTLPGNDDLFPLLEKKWQFEKCTNDPEKRLVILDEMLAFITKAIGQAQAPKPAEQAEEPAAGRFGMFSAAAKAAAKAVVQAFKPAKTPLVIFLEEMQTACQQVRANIAPAPAAAPGLAASAAGGAAT